MTTADDGTRDAIARTRRLAELYLRNFLWALALNGLIYLSGLQSASAAIFLVDTAVLAVLFVAIELVIKRYLAPERLG